MSLEKVGSMALEVANKNSTSAKNEKSPLNVLDEDTHISNLGKIIVRDFFPDLPKIQAQVEFLDAVEKKDALKVWQIQQKYSMKRKPNTPSVYATPSTFETPDSSIPLTPGTRNIDSTASQEKESDDTEQPTRNPEPSDAANAALAKVSLDKYLSKNTSEDNVSFSEIISESEKKHQLKHAWLYKTEQLQIEGDKDSNKLQMWNYIPNNAVMYVPDGVEYSPAEKIKMAGKPREIIHGNTRFTENPFNADKSKESISQAASIQTLRLHGKIGPDGKEILPTNTPTVGGYGFVATPSPAPGVDASPLMTWGEIEGTPFRLDGGDTPLIKSTPGPIFKIPDVPKRDRLLYQMVEKVNKGYRAKKEEALKQATATFSSPSPKFGSSKTERLLSLSSLSPAAQRLASKKLGLKSDKALKASYTPSPGRTPGSGDNLTPSPANRTPGSFTPTKSTTPKSNTPKRPMPQPSLTDNLLKLPKRSKAQDFF